MLVKDLIQEYSVRNKEKKDYPVYSVTNSQGFCKDYFGKEVASKDKSTYKIVPYGCFAYNPSRINVGSIDWQHCEDFVIVSPLYNVFTVNTNITRQDYLSYYFKSHLVSDYINTFAKGSVRLNVPLSTLGNFPVPIPPLAEQERIVAELDLLSSIIDKKKAQLKELDQLAQSIFYDMFGDPITNEKGWEVKKLSEVSLGKLSYGSGASSIPFNDDVRYIRITDINDNGELNEDTVSPNVFDEKYLLNEGDILFARSGATVGKTYCHKNKYGKCIYAGYLIRLIPNKEIVNPLYVFGYTKTSYYMEFVKKAQNAVAQPNINAKQYGDLQICVPPLPLQQEFASKVEAIERQKALIQQSIDEVQTLFNSRMDHWFG